MPRARGRGRRSNRGRGSSVVATPVAVLDETPTSFDLNNSKSLDETIPEERFFLNPNAVSPHLMCSICQEVFNEPYRAPCGHSYCKACIYLWLKTNKSCPEDRKPLNTNSLHKDFIVENIISDYKVACPWRSLGCLFVGPLHSLAHHKNTCHYNPKVMPKVLRDFSKEILEKTSSDLLTKSIQDNLNMLNNCRPGTSANDTTAATTSFDSTNSITGSALLDRLLAESGEADDVDSSGTPDNSHPTPSPSTSSIPSAASTSAMSSNGIASLPNTLDPIISDVDSDEENIPDAPLPPLRMRLYVGGNEESRNLLCNFLEGPRVESLPSTSDRPPAKRQKNMLSI